MRLRSIVLLAAAGVLASVDASASTDLTTAAALSLVADQNGIPSRRLLRSYTTEDEVDGEEERGWLPSSITRLFKSKESASKISTKLSSQATSKLVPKASFVEEAIQPFVKTGASLDDAFTRLNLDKLNLDKLIADPKFKTWLSYMAHFNQYNGKQAKTTAQFLMAKYTEKQVVQIFAAASKSSDQTVRNMGNDLTLDLLKQWVKAGKKPREVARIEPMLSRAYQKLFEKAATQAQKKSAAYTEYLKANARGEAAALRGMNV